MARRIFLLLALVVGVIFLLGVWDDVYLRMRQEGVQNLADRLRQIQDEDYRRAMADTYGGKTPQETLQMYIDAVEKGDYELASKYFIFNGQDKEKTFLGNASKEAIDKLIVTLKKLELDDKQLMLEEQYEHDKKEYGTTESREDFINRIGEIYKNNAAMRTKIGKYDFVVEFFKYPSGIWKIVEI